LIFCASSSGWPRYGKCVPGVPDFDPEPLGQPTGGFGKKWVALRADEKLDRRCDRGERLFIEKVGVEGAALDAEIGIGTREHGPLGARFQALPVCVAGPKRRKRSNAVGGPPASMASLIS
jgi:hypothetical protein